MNSSNPFNIVEESFPLYDELYQMYKDSVEFTQLPVLITLLRRLDHEGLQLVGFIVKKYSSSRDTSSIPFQGTSVNDQDVKFDIRQFDSTLQWMLTDFARRYLLTKSDH